MAEQVVLREGLAHQMEAAERRNIAFGMYQNVSAELKDVLLLHAASIRTSFLHPLVQIFRSGLPGDLMC